MNFPIILEQSDACGVLDGKQVKTPTIAATAVILATRGADQILVPCPSSYELDRTLAGVELLPPERRSTVKTLDRGGDVLKRVREYLRPLAAQASEWPENAFVGLSEAFLYQIALGAKHKAGILSDAAQVVREFVPIIRPQCFTGEPRFRLADLLGLICSYEPHELSHGSLTLETPGPDRYCTEVWPLLNNAEFRAVVAASGKLGYLKHPLVGLRRLQQLLQQFFARDDARRMLSMAKTTADLAGVGTAASSTAHLIESLISAGEKTFRPPFLSLGPAELGIYRAALAEAYPSATPPAGSIMVFERGRGGSVGHSWLNTGEEMKLEREAAYPEKRHQDFVEAKAALRRFLAAGS